MPKSTIKIKNTVLARLSGNCRDEAWEIWHFLQDTQDLPKKEHEKANKIYNRIRGPLKEALELIRVAKTIVLDYSEENIDAAS